MKLTENNGIIERPIDIFFDFELIDIISYCFLVINFLSSIYLFNVFFILNYKRIINHSKFCDQIFLLHYLVIML